MGNIALRLDSANNGDLQQMDSAHEHYIAYQAGIFMASQDSNLVGNLGIIQVTVISEHSPILIFKEQKVTMNFQVVTQHL